MTIYPLLVIHHQDVRTLSKYIEAMFIVDDGTLHYLPLINPYMRYTLIECSKSLDRLHYITLTISADRCTRGLVHSRPPSPFVCSFSVLKWFGNCFPPEAKSAPIHTVGAGTHGTRFSSLRNEYGTKYCLVGQPLIGATSPDEEWFGERKKEGSESKGHS